MAHIQTNTHKMQIKSFLKKKSLDSFKTSIILSFLSHSLQHCSLHRDSLAPSPGVLPTQLQLAVKIHTMLGSLPVAPSHLLGEQGPCTVMRSLAHPATFQSPSRRIAPCLTPLPIYQIYPCLSAQCWLLHPQNPSPEGSYANACCSTPSTYGA